MFLYVMFEVHQILPDAGKQEAAGKSLVSYHFVFWEFFICIIFHHVLQKSVFFVTSSLFPPAFLTATYKPRLQKRLPIRIWELVEFHPCSCFILKCTSCVLVWCACGIDGAAAAWWRLRGSSRMWCLDKDTAQSRTTC